jgi:agarase
LGIFTLHFARQYFRTVRQAILSIDPDHLYLGSRFHIYTPEVLEAAAEFVDVISFNIYQTKIDPARWAFLNDLDKPVIIGEFHFGALDRGMFHTGLVAATDQENRATMFKTYLRSVVDHPSFVGAHWFQYTDQPLTGRTLDGENYNIGFVTVTDDPYPEMVRSAREVLTELYRRRAGWVGKPSRRK